LDLSWRTPFEVVLPGRTPAEVRNLCRARGGGWLRKGLHVRISGDRVLARFNEFSKYAPSVPLLRGRLMDDPQGTRIVGRLQWTAQLGALAALGLSVVAGVGALGATVAQRDPAGILVALVAIGVLGAAFAFHLAGHGNERVEETRRLHEGLQSLFARH
jgi:hypothetical protein